MSRPNLLANAERWQLMDDQGNPLAQDPMRSVLPHIGSGRYIPRGYDPGVYHVQGHEFLQLGGLGVSSMGVDSNGTVLLDGEGFWVRIVGRPLVEPGIFPADEDPRHG